MWASRRSSARFSAATSLWTYSSRAFSSPTTSSLPTFIGRPRKLRCRWQASIRSARPQMKPDAEGPSKAFPPL
jgi:hypothetical protein